MYYNDPGTMEMEVNLFAVVATFPLVRLVVVHLFYFVYFYLFIFFEGYLNLTRQWALTRTIRPKHRVSGRLDSMFSL